MRNIIITIAAVLTLMSCTTEDRVEENNTIYEALTSENLWAYPDNSQAWKFKYDFKEEFVMQIYLFEDSYCYRLFGSENSVTPTYYVSDDIFYITTGEAQEEKLFFMMEGDLLKLMLGEDEFIGYLEADSTTPICN